LLSEEDQNGIRKIKNKLPELQDEDEENRNEVTNPDNQRMKCQIRNVK
jgi:hypothetical protein